MRWRNGDRIPTRRAVLETRKKSIADWIWPKSLRVQMQKLRLHRALYREIKEKNRSPFRNTQESTRARVACALIGHPFRMKRLSLEKDCQAPTTFTSSIRSDGTIAFANCLLSLLIPEICLNQSKATPETIPPFIGYFISPFSM